MRCVLKAVSGVDAAICLSLIIIILPSFNYIPLTMCRLTSLRLGITIKAFIGAHMYIPLERNTMSTLADYVVPSSDLQQLGR